MKRETPELRLSLGTLYRRIAADKTQGGNLYTKLPRFGKSRCKGGKCNRRRALIPDRVDSIQRPQVMEKRSRIGDWEGDTGHGENAYLVTLAERQSRLVLIGKVVDRVETVAQCLSEWLRRVDNGPTIRLDNGGDFAHHDQVAKSSQATVYFAKPYASYQRGTENTNGLIRDFWPKGTDVKPLDDTEIRHREFCLNMPLSVVLGGLTPLEIYTGRSVALICVNPAVYAMCTIVYMIYT